jgi:glycerol-3-phosphate acyltransferase PlsY
MLIQFISLTIAAYLAGSIPTAYLVAKWRRGIDIRQFGSGNVGAANVMAAVSKRWSLAVTIFDVAKGALMVGLARIFNLSEGQQIVIGLAAIIGHNWTVFLNFNGGRGIFTSLGVIIMLSPKVGLIALVLSYLFAPFHLLSLGVTIALIALPILSWFFSQPLSIKDPVPVSLGFLAILVIAMFRRLTVPRSPISASIPNRELLFYRFFFDRDIKDRQTWVTQTRGEAKIRESQ